MPGLDPLEDGVPGHAAGEEGWADTTGDAATDAITFEDGSALKLMIIMLVSMSWIATSRATSSVPAK